MFDRFELPTAWRPDYTLKNIIPASVDWRSYAKIPYAPRYAASITGEGVYDLKRRTFVSPTIDKRNGRKRYRLNCDDKCAGKRATVKMPYYASIICTLVEGARPSRIMQAHHTTHDRTQDHWACLSWASRKANQRMAVEHRDRRGSANPNSNKALQGNALATFIAAYDNERREHGHVDLKPYSEYFKMTIDQLRRIATERSRRDEVRAIRVFQRQQREEKERQLRQALTDTSNPFLAAFA